MGSHEVAGKSYFFTKTSQMGSFGVIFTSTYHTKQLNPWPNSSASCVVAKGICSHIKATRTLMDLRQASETSPSKSSLCNFQHQYLAELLVNIYSYCLMVKSVSCCCVRGSRLFSNLVTYTNGKTARYIVQPPQPRFASYAYGCSLIGLASDQT